MRKSPVSVSYDEHIDQVNIVRVNNYAFWPEYYPSFGKFNMSTQSYTDYNNLNDTVDYAYALDFSLLQLPGPRALVVYHQSDSLSSNASVFNNMYLHVKKVNFETGVLVFDSIIGQGGPGLYLTRSKILTENRIALMGTKQEANNNANFHGYAMIIDSNANVIKELNIYSNYHGEFIRNIEKIGDGYILFGIDNNVGDFFVTERVLDSNFNVLSYTNYQNPNYSTDGFSSLGLKDGSILINYSRYLPNGNSSHSLIKEDVNQNVIWEHQSPYNDQEVSFSHLYEHSDASISLVGVALDESNHQTVVVQKRDPKGILMWEKEYDRNPNYGNFFYDAEMLSDSNLIFVGTYVDSVIGEQLGWVVSLNCNGEEGHQYPLSDTCFVYDCTQYPMQGDFSASKTYIDLSVENGAVQFENVSPNTIYREWDFDDGYMAFTDSSPLHVFQYNGLHKVELVSHHGACKDTSYKYVEVINGINSIAVEDLDLSLKIFPNPFSDQVTFTSKYQFEGIKVFDLKGRLVLTKDLLNLTEYKLDTTDLPEGCFVVEVTFQNNKTIHRKLIKR